MKKEKIDIMNRKEFLSDCGKIGFAGVTLSLFPWLQSCSDKAKQEVKGEKARIGIIGTGSRGCFHIKHLVQMPNVEVVALCDNYRPHLEDAAQYYPKAKLYDDYRHLLEQRDVEGVIIATPLYLHAPMTLDALSAGKRVFCEKSMGYTLDECLEVYNKRKETNGVLFIGQQRLFDPKYIKAMSMIHEGKIGDVVGVRNYWYRNNNWRRDVPSPELERHINWRLYSEYSRGLMTELACHQLQNGSWALGMLPEQVMGSGHLVHWLKEDKRDVYDCVSAIFTYPNGVNMTFESIISNKHFGMGEQILGTNGTIDLVTGMYYSDEPAPKGSGMHQLIAQIESGVMSNSVFAGTSWAAESSPLAPGVPIMPNVKVVTGESTVGAEADGSRELLEAFIHATITGRQPEKVLEESYYATQFALLADKAMHENQILRLDEKYKIPYTPLK
ncbi:MAG: Gfo/Idh/MocA family oxidoreductase [Alistipes sp.]|jgi:predicted dehydrogenase|nr:Gfo/Idh/MocA family oxidoreductase [Alistipes sp.]MBQ5622348.1 Gfo/Idh/MocA family oxidoreductase [Alistipes sp.]MBQ5785791.1 Gfo/Idh/MocA family oxidoreductase [Alistipes sp.]